MAMRGGAGRQFAARIRDDCNEGETMRMFENTMD